MKRLLIFLLMILSIIVMISCIKITESEPITVVGKIIYRHHEDQKTKYGYHYGYSLMKRKYCNHYGSYDVDEKNIVSFVFLGDTITKDSKSLLNKPSDVVEITYVKVFHSKKNEEPKFDHYEMRDIK